MSYPKSAAGGIAHGLAAIEGALGPDNTNPRWRRWTLRASPEALALCAGVYVAAVFNGRFLASALAGRSSADPSTWGLAAALMVVLASVHAVLVLLVATRRAVKPVIGVLLVVAAAAAFFIDAYGVYLDPSMMRNVARTHPAEARELLSWRLLVYLAAAAGLPMLLLWRVRVVPRSMRRALAMRSLSLVLLLLALVGSVLSVYQPLSSMMRNHREMRYLITPANVLWSAGAVAAAELKGAAEPRKPIGLDAAAGPSWAHRSKPLVVVLVVGETVRSANWGLSGAARQTTPQLAARNDLTNFARVRACGTNTETSLPCMFAPVGRRDYDEGRIRGQDSLLHIVSRAGVQVHWRDNQSGCKGVCDGLPAEQVTAATAPALCADGHCLDEALVADLRQRLASAKGTQLWVLHMLGSHGPSYFRRYPAAFAKFQPECRHDDLQRCTVEQIANAYDNSILYTDHVLASALAQLKAMESSVDSALIYVSDHGESLGEHGLFLHGVPYAIAPDVQTQVPLVIWHSQGLEKAAGLRSGCLAPSWQQRMQKQQAEPVAHDHVFHTILGLLDVRTGLHAPAWDLTAGCAGAAGARP